MKSYVVRNSYTLYLNSEMGCTKNAIGSKNISFTWDINPILITEIAKLRVFLLQYQGTGSNTKDSIVSFKLRDVLYNAGNYYSSDGSYPNIFAGVLNQTAQTNVYYTGMGSLELIPQAINTLTILITDSLTNINSGVDDTYKFMIGITIDDYGMEK